MYKCQESLKLEGRCGVGAVSELTTATSDVAAEVRDYATIGALHALLLYVVVVVVVVEVYRCSVFKSSTASAAASVVVVVGLKAQGGGCGCSRGSGRSRRRGCRGVTPAAAAAERLHPTTGGGDVDRFPFGPNLDAFLIT